MGFLPLSKYTIGLSLFCSLALSGAIEDAKCKARRILIALKSGPFVDSPLSTNNGITALDQREAVTLFEQGYVVRPAFFGEGFTTRFIAELKRLHQSGNLKAGKDRIVEGVETEVGTSIGDWPEGKPPEGLIAILYDELKQFAYAFNAQFPEYAVTPETAELNISIAFPGWTGLHLHVDHHRFTEALKLLPLEKHKFIKQRTLTISGYAREAEGIGGGLEVVPPGFRRDESLYVHSNDNTAVIFFARTPHAVAPIPKPGNDEGIRYSFQVFFHAVDNKAPPPAAFKHND